MDISRYEHLKNVSYENIIVFVFSCLTFCRCKEREVYVFSYFKGNGEDGLHLAVSEDGLSWKTLKNDSSFFNHN